VNAEASSLIARGRYHAPLPRTSYGHWLTAQVRIVTLLYTGEERIEVTMNDTTFGKYAPVAFLIALRRRFGNLTKIGAQHGLHG
jgi:hypothetical protein